MYILLRQLVLLMWFDSDWFSIQPGLIQTGFPDWFSNFSLRCGFPDWFSRLVFQMWFSRLVFPDWYGIGFIQASVDVVFFVTIVSLLLSSTIPLHL